MIRRLLLGIMLAVVGSVSYAQSNIASYTFTKSTDNSYVPLENGTVLFPIAGKNTYDNEVSAALTLSQPFIFGGVAQNTVYVSSNGFITFGSAPSTTTYTPLSTLGSTTGAVSAFGQDGGFSSSDTTQPPGVHQVSYEDLGTEFVVQFQDHANYYNRSTEKLNFQIRLEYATGNIKIIYGDCTLPGSSTSNSTVQVGIRGNSTTFANNVISLMAGNIPANTTCNWADAVSGNLNSSTMLFTSGTNAAVNIPNGLAFEFAPGEQMPVRTFSAVTDITNEGATINWTAPENAAFYNVQYRVVGDCLWTDYELNPVAENSVTLSGLLANEAYQVQVQASNGSEESIYSHIPNQAGTGSGYALTGTFKTMATCQGLVTGLTATNITPSSTTLSWTESTISPEMGYEYYISTSSTAPSLSTTITGSTEAGIVTADITDLAPDTLHYYWLRANCSDEDKGIWSTSSSFRTLSLCPTVTAPTANAAGVSTLPTISWNPINGATGYILLVGTTSGGSDILNNVDLGDVTSYTFEESLASATKYFYTVSGYTENSTINSCSVRNFTTACTAYTELPWTENFDSMTTVGSAVLPTCWVNTTGTKAWTSMSTGNNYYSAPNSAPNYVSLAYSNTNASQLWTPSFALEAGVSYEFSFNYHTSYAGFTGSVLVNNSASVTDATDLGTFISSAQIVSTYKAHTVIFTPETSDNYTFGLTATSTVSPWYLSVDDFKLQVAPTCIKPVPTAVTAINAAGATVNWTASESEPGLGYEVYIATTNATPAEDAAPTVTAIFDTTTAVTGLDANTTYYAFIRSVCSDSDTSEWSARVSFTTTGLCTTVTAPALNAQGAALQPTFTWNSVAGATGYSIKIGTTSGESDILDLDLGDTTSYTLAEELANSTTYYYTIVAYTGSSTIANCAVRTFTTICNAYTELPWTENFDSMTTVGSAVLPSCWINTTGSKAWTSMNTNTTTYNAPNSAPNYVSIAFSNTNASQLWTPSFLLEAGVTYELSFNFRTNIAGYTGSVLVNNSATTTDAINLGSFITITETANPYKPHSVIFTPESTDVFTFGLTVTSNSTPWYLGVDDFKLQIAPDCVKPTGLTATNITQNSAVLNWQESTSTSDLGYDVYVSTINAAPTEDTVPTATGILDTTYEVENLTGSTNQYFFVRTVCSATEVSEWSVMGTFMTTISNDDCIDAIELIAGSTFESSAVTVSNVGATTDMSASCQSNSGSNVWFSVVVPASGNITIETKQSASSIFDDSILVAFSGTCDELTVIDCNDDNEDEYDWYYDDYFTYFSKLKLEDRTPGEVILVSVWSYGANGDKGAFRIAAYDASLSIKEDAVVEKNVAVFPNPFTNTLNISDITDVTSINIIDMAGRIVKTYTTAQSTLELSDLNAGLYIVQLQNNDGSVKTIKAMKK